MSISSMTIQRLSFMSFWSLIDMLHDMKAWLSCKLGWHSPDHGFRNAYKDGIGRPHAWCKYCGIHIPLFSFNRKKDTRYLFGEYKIRGQWL